jgi:hypothetical protein
MSTRATAGMQVWWAAIVAIATVTSPWIGPATGESSSDLIAGGLTSLPAVVLGPDLLRNGGFEALEGGVPLGWSSGAGWTVDPSTRHDGARSYRRSTGAPSVSQTVLVGPGTYTLSAWIKTEGLGRDGTAGVRLMFDTRPAGNDWQATDVISGTRDWTRYQIPNLVVSHPATVQIALESSHDPAGTAWFDDVRLEEQQPPAIDVFMRHPNFRGMLFDDDPSALSFDVTVRPPSGDADRYVVRGTLREENGATVATRTYAAIPRFVAVLDGGPMRSARAYLATFALVDRSDGAVVFTYPPYRVSRVSAARRASMNVAVDARNRVLVRGVPRFVLGLYDAGGEAGATDRSWEEHLWSPTGARRLHDLRFNFYVSSWPSEASADAVRALVANLRRHGVTYLHTASCFGAVAPGAGVGLEGGPPEAPPGAGGYYTGDECSAARLPSVFAQYERLRRLQPDGITFMANLADARLALWRDAADVLASDPFPLARPEPADGDHGGQVAQWTAATRAAVHDARPVMTVLQLFPSGSEGRFPTRAEMRDQAYAAIVEGARGLWWWSVGGNGLPAVCPGWCARRTTYMSQLAAVVNELAALEPALVADDAPAALAAVSTSQIRTRTKVVDGRGYVFAYNAANATARATFTWNAEPGSVTVLGEPRAVPVLGDSFSDSFGPYQAHVYVIAKGGH